MEFAVAVAGIIGALVALVTLGVNVSQYRLQRGAVAAPGRKVESREAHKILDEIDEDPVRAIAADHIFIQSDKSGVGYIVTQPIAVYLDMHTASCVPAKRAVLARSLADFVEEGLGTDLKGVLIATPREGNLLVGSSVAELLGSDFLMIRTGRAPRFGYPIEGTFLPGATAVIADDLCMEGSFLATCVNHLRAYGLNVSDVFCLFERMDGDAREGLAEVGVELHSKYQIDDDELKQLKGVGRLRPAAPAGPLPSQAGGGPARPAGND
ncbi:hypothetical protein AB0B66_31655 [Catellatospora sp. NPDC049111]|uniref:hypothetical protein n=1 Tax=Catellatospora sp. NPDC049111 TaxID=3155271 RepID=UPI0033F1C1AA